MILQPKQAKRFYRLFDTLIVYANDQLHVTDRLLSHYGELDDLEALKVVQALWDGHDNRYVIARFVDENPYRFSRADLKEVARWECGIYDLFNVDRRGRDICFLYSEHAIAVRGLTREIDTMLNQTPSTVETVLLPFENAVVYGMSISEMPIGMGPGILKVIANELDESFAEGRVIRSGADFERRAAELEKAALDREAEHFAYQTELDMNADVQVEGQHRGVLAGLSPEEREAAVQAELDRVGLDSASLVKTVAKSCYTGTPARTLDESFNKLNKPFLQDLAYSFGVRGSVSSMNKAKLIEAVKPHIPTDRGSLLGMVRTSGTSAVRDVAKLVAAGGELRVRDEEVTSHDSVILPMFPLMLTYHRDGVFTTVMPSDVLAKLSDVDWNGQLSRAGRIDKSLKIVDLLVDLHGIVYLDEVLDELERHLTCDDEFFSVELLPAIVAASGGAAIGCVLDTLGGDPVLVDYGIAQRLDGASGGERDGILFDLLDQQEGKPFRSVSDELVATGSVNAWVMKGSEARALMAYLDEHVPDEADDYFFAEDVTADIIDLSRDFVNPVEALHIIEDYGFMPTEAQLKRLIDLVMNLANAVPKWTNNGWSPMELHEMTGR